MGNCNCLSSNNTNFDDKKNEVVRLVVEDENNYNVKINETKIDDNKIIIPKNKSGNPNGNHQIDSIYDNRNLDSTINSANYLHSNKSCKNELPLLNPNSNNPIQETIAIENNDFNYNLHSHSVFKVFNEFRSRPSKYIRKLQKYSMISDELARKCFKYIKDLNIDN
jgi:hypothetical protein